MFATKYISDQYDNCWNNVTVIHFITAIFNQPNLYIYKTFRLYFQDTIQTLQSAEAGLGIAIAHAPFVFNAIQSGKLAIPVDIQLKLPENYYLLCPESNLNQPKIKKLRNWLLHEIKNK